jgi:hypothetical protein
LFELAFFTESLWLKDESLEASDNFPDHDVIAQEIEKSNIKDLTPWFAKI